MYSTEIVQSPLGQAVLNGTKILMREIQLRQLLKAHEELVRLKIGVAGKMGFVPAAETTASWRSLSLQRQLVAKGASMTLLSNHRRATAVDCYADWDYIDRIKATMNKYGFVNDLAYIKNSKGQWVKWDGGHWNWIGNSHASYYGLIDTLPALIKTVSMQEYENTVVQLTQPGFPDSGRFALVIEGSRHWIDTNNTKKTLEALLTIGMAGMRPCPLTKAAWDSIPEGEPWATFKRKA
jgi:hypothetical protein